MADNLSNCTHETPTGVTLASFSNSGFQRGRPAFVEALWILIQALFISSFLPGSTHRRFLLRLFGAQIGNRVTIKPGVRIKFPWRLIVASDVWIGENVWIDNLAEVRLEANSCLSQGAYLCTGSHDWTSNSFDLMVKPIVIGESAWIAAKAMVGPGVIVHERAVLTMGSVATSVMAPGCIFQGVPARKIKLRMMRESIDAAHGA
ncbi:MAG: WcaF family extracellular polysaccharide biosynthesis acetyltransferase [Rhodomicrobium sp.]